MGDRKGNTHHGGAYMSRPISSMPNSLAHLLCVIAIIIAFALSGCGSITNTIAGLSTLQSTISGSNYVFLVDPDNGKLMSDLPALKAGNNIGAGDYFCVSLDAGFLRYLQAVDPYVIVYSESWMGKKATAGRWGKNASPNRAHQGRYGAQCPVSFNLLSPPRTDNDGRRSS